VIKADYTEAKSKTRFFRPAKAHPKRGLNYYQQEEGEGAITDFNRFLGLSPEFAMEIEGLSIIKKVIGTWLSPT